MGTEKVEPTPTTSKQCTLARRQEEERFGKKQAFIERIMVFLELELIDKAVEACNKALNELQGQGPPGVEELIEWNVLLNYIQQQNLTNNQIQFLRLILLLHQKQDLQKVLCEMKKWNFTKVTSCPICDIVTEPNDVYSLIQHAITDFKHFGLEINPFVCTIITCGESFDTPFDLSDHLTKKKGNDFYHRKEDVEAIEKALKI